MPKELKPHAIHSLPAQDDHPFAVRDQTDSDPRYREGHAALPPSVKSGEAQSPSVACPNLGLDGPTTMSRKVVGSVTAMISLAEPAVRTP